MVALREPGFWSGPGFSWRHLTDPQPQTITEQLVSDLLLPSETPNTRRALRMRLLSAQLVARYGRAQVLEWYLNSASFGHLAYGVDQAARLYLDQSASQLDFGQAAVLLAALQTPALNPLDAPTAAQEQRQIVLETLHSRGIMTEDEVQRWLSQPPGLRQNQPASQTLAAAFTNLAIQQLSERLGRERVERGGLRVVTTLDWPLQMQLLCTLRTQLARMEAQTALPELPKGETCQADRLLPTLAAPEPPLPAGLMGSGMLLDPRSGEILAYIGDTTLSTESSLLSTHTPGSILTPFVAVAGFARGYSPASLLWDTPPAEASTNSSFANPDDQYHGPVRFRTALANDYLASIHQVLEKIGPANVWRFNQPLGLTRLVSSRTPSELLYTGGESTLSELAFAYSAFPNLGVQAGRRFSSNGKLQSNAVLSLSDVSGRVWLEPQQPETSSALSPQLAYLIHNVLSDEAARWPSLGYPNPLEIGRPAGAKIGQTADHQQTWVAGYTKQRLAIIWIGLPAEKGTTRQLDTRPAAGVWHAMMQYANQDLPIEVWNPLPGISTVQVCDPSGQLPTADCPLVVSETFLNGTEPTSTDTLYRKVQVNRETDLLATVFTPLELVEDRVFLVVPDELRDWAAQVKLPQPPSGYDQIQVPAPLAGAAIRSPQAFAYVSGKVALRGSASGDQFASYSLQFGQGLNPSTWQQIGTEQTQAVEDGVLAEWDTQGLDGLVVLRLSVVRQDRRIDTAILQVTVDNTAPRATLRSPQEGQILQPGSSRLVTLSADVQENVGLSKLEWLLDGKKIGETIVAPYSFPWAATPGGHALVLRATDLAGNTAESAPVNFTVK